MESGTSRLYKGNSNDNTSHITFCIYFSKTYVWFCVIFICARRVGECMNKPDCKLSITKKMSAWIYSHLFSRRFDPEWRWLLDPSPFLQYTATVAILQNPADVQVHPVPRSPDIHGYNLATTLPEVLGIHAAQVDSHGVKLRLRNSTLCPHCAFNSLAEGPKDEITVQTTALKPVGLKCRMAV